tara:strand:+ start:1499 stop:1801 length:303 start_codon:yes stop_codon:yes gene_type:complete
MTNTYDDEEWKKILKVNKEKFIRYGRYYKYAECCINSFLKQSYGSNNEGMFQGTKKTGFIPCNVCFKKVIDIYHQKYKNKMMYGEYTIEYAWVIYQDLQN